MRVSQSWSTSTADAWNEFWYTLRTSPRMIAAVLLATVGSAYLALQSQSDVYESAARILVKLGRENMEPPVTVEKGTVAFTGVRKEEIFTHVVLLSSQPLVEQTLDEIGVDAFRPALPAPRTVFERIRQSLKNVAGAVTRELEDLLVALNIQKRLDFREKLLLALQDSLIVERDKESDVILARLRLASPELAQRFLTVLIRRYRDAHIELRKDATSSDFFERKTSTYRGTVDAYAEAEARVRADYGLSSIDEDRRRLLGRKHALQAEIEGDQRDLALVKDAADDTSDDAGRVPNSVPGTEQSLQLMKDRIAQQRMRRIQMSSLFQPEADQVSNINKEIAALELAFSRAVRQRISLRRSQIDAIEKRLSDINDGERKLEDLERERGLALKSYSAYAERWEEARIAEELDRRRVANISLLSAPSLPVKPVKPNRLLIMVLSIPAGLVLGIAAAIFTRGLSNRIRRPDDLARVEGLAYLGTFDLNRPRARARQ